jgi:hypothetical protein
LATRTWPILPSLRPKLPKDGYSWRIRLRDTGKDHQRHWATLPVAVVRLGRPTPTPVDTALGRGEPDLLGLPMQRQVDEVIGSTSFARNRSRKRKFVGVHPARWAAAFQGIHAARSKRPLAQRRTLMKLVRQTFDELKRFGPQHDIL